MEIVTITRTEFRRARRAMLRGRLRGTGRKPNPAYDFVAELAVGAAWRVKDHPHVVPVSKKNTMTCGFSDGVRHRIVLLRRRASLMHDGPDLLVMRVK